MKTEKVSGTNASHDVTIFTLSTCGWCRKTKELLKDLGVKYEYIDMDKIEGMDQITARTELKKHNPRASYPTIVIDNGKMVIIGFKEDEIRGVFS